MTKAKGKILVVDDSVETLQILRAILFEHGYEVRTAKNGTNALEAVSSEHPDLILLDIEMPGMKGYEVCQRLKADESTKDIPVLFISASDQVLNKVEAFSAGGGDYITKPFHVEEVLIRVDTHMALRSLVKTLEDTNTELNYEISRRHAYEKQLEQLAIRDALTKAFNRRFFIDAAEKEIDRARRNGLPISLLMIDIDHFKQVNDDHGHLVGDQVLINLVKLCQSKIRDVDIFARYGGEEFVILMPNANCEAAIKTAERLRQAVFESFMATGRANVLITLSVGVACWDTVEEVNIDSLLEKADKALYRSKELGRNRVLAWGKN
jgi:diguanylate cyclase (GGDEF)-like protein